MITVTPPCRLSVILARRAPIAAILRRGPSKWGQLSVWDTSTDKIEHGQWFHGRIYEKRCDLSPDGLLFLYFAQKKNARTIADQEYTYAWTAISKLPYLTALALWPKGDCWHGGGLFDSQDEVWLNHRPDVAHPHPAHLPYKLKVTPNPDAYGENWPVYERRRLRDGWIVAQAGRFPWREQPKVWIRQNQAATHRLVERWVGYSTSKLGSDTVLEFSLQEINTGVETTLPFVEWADWDQQNRLVFARDGMLFAAEINGESVHAHIVADLNAERPSTMAAPEWATQW
jgi:hypothetical protein